jgi:hypothetical protein
MNGTRSSWIWSGSWSPNADCHCPDIPEPAPFNAEELEELNLGGFGAAVFTGGFRPDYESWVRFPGAFDELGFPIHEEGASSVVPGLYFVGVHFLRKRRSSLLNGIGEDAAIVARQIAAREGPVRRSGVGRLPVASVSPARLRVPLRKRCWRIGAEDDVDEIIRPGTTINPADNSFDEPARRRHS